VILIIIVFVGVYVLRRQTTKPSDVEVPAVETKETATAIRLKRSRGTSNWIRSASIPFLPPHRITEPVILATKRSYEDRSGSAKGKKPKKRQKRRPSAHRVFSKFSTGVRDSWPLGSSMQIPSALRLQSNSTLTLNQVAPPGYLVPSDPKRPNRTYSRKSRSQIHVPSSGATSRLSKEPPSPNSHPGKPVQRRTLSENHLSTVLRSTSERLRVSHRRSLSRTLTVINRRPETLPEPFFTPNKVASESREVLIDHMSTLSGSSSFLETILAQTPNPDRKNTEIAGQANSKRKATTPPSAGSDDSLCAKDTSDVVIPSPLTSPSKNWNRGQQRHSSRIPTNNSSTSTLLHKGSRASAFALGSQNSDRDELFFINQPQTPPALDPFYSTSKIARRSMPINEGKDLSPRPLYIRKSTFGPLEASKRTSNFAFPLKDISGNMQSSPRLGQTSTQTSSSSSDVIALNPFRWSPHEAVRPRLNSASPTRSEVKSKKGHKRSKVIRMSNLPRPSSVAMVPEESEDESQSHNLAGLKSSVRLVKSSRSPSPTQTSLMSRRLTVRPPSSSTFNPIVSVPSLLSENAIDKSSTGIEIYSPTLGITKYYNEATTAKDVSKPKLPERAATARHTRRESSISPADSPSRKLDEMISFPKGASPGKPKSPALSPNSEILRALESQKSSSAASPVVPAYSGLALTMPIPGHLTGPRAQPRRYSSQRLPPKGTLRESICMLRRMNSDVSIMDSPSSVYSNSSALNPSPVDSPRPIRQQSPSPSPLRRVNQNQASENYLSLGTSMHRQRVEKQRDSPSGPRERRLRQREHAFQKVESEAELTPVREVTSSPASAINAVEISALLFPRLSNDKPIPQMPYLKPAKEGEKKSTPTKPTKASRWSDAMPKPSLKGVSREPQIKHLSAVDPPKWGWGIESKIRLVTALPEDLEGKENAKNKHGNRSPARSDGGSEGNISPEGAPLPKLAEGIKVDHAGWEATKKKRGWGNWNAKARLNLNPRLPRAESTGLYDSDGFLKSSPDRGVALLEVRRR
jgi:hypothetical protein